MPSLEKTCCFTGHRELPSNLHEIKRRTMDATRTLIEKGVQFFGAGGAFGFDTLAAQCVLELREKHPQIKLILVLPCADQTSRWLETDIEVYQKIKVCADKIVYTHQGNYYRGCMQVRNRHLVKHSRFCICYLTKNSGGTYGTVNLAKKNGLYITNVADFPIDL